MTDTARIQTTTAALPEITSGDPITTMLCSVRGEDQDYPVDYMYHIEREGGSLRVLESIFQVELLDTLLYAKGEFVEVNGRTTKLILTLADPVVHDLDSRRLHRLVNRLLITYSLVLEIVCNFTDPKTNIPQQLSYVNTHQPSPQDANETIDVTFCPITGAALALVDTRFCQ